MIKKLIKIPIYDIPFTLVIYWDDEKLLSLVNGAEFNHSVDEFDGGMFEFNQELFLAFKAYKFNGIPRPKNSVIAHECLHLVNKVMELIGHEPSRINDEPEAYLLLYLIDTVEDFISKNREKIVFE